MPELEKCVVCGKAYTGWGNSTWGLWKGLAEMDIRGEKLRCCDACNRKYVVPARMGLIEQLEVPEL